MASVSPARLPRLSPDAYVWLCRLALFALAFIVVTGASVRLTGSGLGCSDWPTCEQNQLVAALDKPHAMVEFVNRTITGLVSLAVILAVLGSLVRVPRRRDLVYLSLGLVAGMIGQIVLGGLTVKFELAPPFVMGHFVLSAVLVWNAVVLEHRARQPAGPPVPIVEPVVRNLSRAMCALASLVLLTGTVVTGSGPHGGDERVKRLTFYIPTVARLHAVLVITFLLLAVVTLWRLKQAGAPRVVETRARVLVVAILVQGAIGYTQYFTGVPPVLVGLHVLGSMVVWMAVLYFHLGLWTRAGSNDEPGDDRTHATTDTVGVGRP